MKELCRDFSLRALRMCSERNGGSPAARPTGWDADSRVPCGPGLRPRGGGGGSSSQLACLSAARGPSPTPPPHPTSAAGVLLCLQLPCLQSIRRPPPHGCDPQDTGGRGSCRAGRCRPHGSRRTAAFTPAQAGHDSRLSVRPEVPPPSPCPARLLPSATAGSVFTVPCVLVAAWPQAAPFRPPHLLRWGHRLDRHNRPRDEEAGSRGGAAGAAAPRGGRTSGGGSVGASREGGGGALVTGSAGERGGSQPCTKLAANVVGKAQAPRGRGRAWAGGCLDRSPSAPGARPARC